MSKFMTQDKLAFDRASVRSIDKFGHMMISECPISKAAVNNYYGREIPKADELGLDPNRVYKLLRDPDELKKAASTFNGKPLLSVHKPQHAEDHSHALTVGSVGQCSYEHPYLKTRGMSVWANPSIAGIENGTSRELSSSYGYDADMTPGAYEGQAYDGVMRNIHGNHVALVEDGRAGDDIVVGDAAPTFSYFNKFQGTHMKKSLMPTVARGALMAYAGPKLAADQKLDLTPIVKGLTAKNYKESIPKIKVAMDKATVGKLAKDADLKDLVELLDELQPMAEELEADEDDTTTTPATDDDGDMQERLKKVLAEMGMPEDKIATVLAAMNPEVKTDPPAGDPPAEDEAALAAKKAMITKPAMDAAIKSAVDASSKAIIAKMKGAEAARAAVMPYVGPVDVAMDSADDIYAVALKAHGVKTEGVHPSAFPTLLSLVPKPGDRPKQHPTHVALDKQAVTEYDSVTGGRKLKNR